MSEVWVVEVKRDGEWVPTRGAEPDKPEADFTLRNWVRHSPSHDYRLRRYVRAEAEKERGDAK